MRKFSLVAVAVATVFSGAAFAQSSEFIVERQNAMKAVGQAARAATQLVRGDAYEPAKAIEAMTAMEAASAKYPTLFPDNTKEGGNTRAAPRIWEDKAGFQAANARFIADIQAAKASANDKAAFSAAFGKVGANCNACHEVYRVNRN